MSVIRVTVDSETHEVLLIGADGRYEARLTWASAANLGSLLNAASREAEPPARPGKTYQPTVGRWG